jgi:hypothetical protein
VIQHSSYDRSPFLTVSHDMVEFEYFSETVSLPMRNSSCSKYSMKLGSVLGSAE